MLVWRVGLVVALLLAVGLATAAPASALILGDPDCGRGAGGGGGSQPGPGPGSGAVGAGVLPDMGHPGWDGTGDPPAQPPGPPPPPTSFEDGDRWCIIYQGKTAGYLCSKTPPPGAPIVGSITYVHERYNEVTGEWETVFSRTEQCYSTGTIRTYYGYGRLRAGCAEGGLMSDFTVDPPVCTLSVRG